MEESRRPGERAPARRVGTHEPFHQLAHGRVGGWLGWQDARDSRLDRFRQADPEVEPERLRDLLGKEAPGRPAVHAPDDLADEPAEAAHVVAVRGARLPQRCLRREGLDHRVPGERLLQGEVAFDAGQPRAVRK